MSEQETGVEPAAVSPAAPVPPRRVRRDRSSLRAFAVVFALFLAVGMGLILTGNDEQGAGDDEPAAFTGCDAVVTTPTSLNRDHVLDDRDLRYPTGPPSFGPHLTSPAPFGRPFYTAADRPRIGNLVHSLEHGFTVAWYDDQAADDASAMAELEELARDYEAASQLFIAAPWHSADGGAFPDDRHYALTRWSADAEDPSNQLKQRGNWMYCGTLDADAIDDFVERWPNEESPEPGIGQPELTET